MFGEQLYLYTGMAPLAYACLFFLYLLVYRRREESGCFVYIQWALTGLVSLSDLAGHTYSMREGAGYVPFLFHSRTAHSEYTGWHRSISLQLGKFPIQG